MENAAKPGKEQLPEQELRSLEEAVERHLAATTEYLNWAAVTRAHGADGSQLLVPAGDAWVIATDHLGANRKRAPVADDSA